MTLTIEGVDRWFNEHPHYYTDGKHFHRFTSYRKMKGLRHVGCFLDAKEARIAWERSEKIINDIQLKRQTNEK